MSLQFKVFELTYGIIYIPEAILHMLLFQAVELLYSVSSHYGIENIDIAIRPKHSSSSAHLCHLPLKTIILTAIRPVSLYYVHTL